MSPLSVSRCLCVCVLFFRLLFLSVCLSLLLAESPAVSVKQSLTGGGDRGASKPTATSSTTTTTTTANNNSNSSLIAHITSLPGFDPTKARIVKHYTSKFASSSSDPSTSCPSGNHPTTHSHPESHSKANRNTLTLNTYNNNSNFSISSASDRERITPTAAESFLPWRRDRSYQTFGMCVCVSGPYATLAYLRNTAASPLDHPLPPSAPPYVYTQTCVSYFFVCKSLSLSLSLSLLRSLSLSHVCKLRCKLYPLVYPFVVMFDCLFVLLLLYQYDLSFARFKKESKQRSEANQSCFGY